MTNTEHSKKKDNADETVTYFDLSESDREKLTGLENTIEKETGEKVALVAYRI